MYFEKYNNYYKHALSYDSVSQFYGMFDVSQLCLEYVKSNNITYDYILRLRIDDIILNNFKLDNLNNDEIVVNMIQDYSNSIKVHDHFYMAKPDTYFIVSNLYNNLSNVITYVNSNNYYIPGSGYQETILFIQIIMNNIKIKTANGYSIIKKH